MTARTCNGKGKCGGSSPFDFAQGQNDKGLGLAGRTTGHGQFDRLGGTVQTVLTIAGFDPSSGAGVTADLMVFAAHGLFGTSCIPGLTVQSTVGVRSTTAVSPEVVRATLDCLASDLPPAGIKI